MPFGEVSNHLLATARKGFLEGTKAGTYPWQGITQVVNLGAANETLVDLGAAPMPREQKDRGQVRDFIEKSLSVTSTPWEITVAIDRYDVEDDQTSSLMTQARGAGQNFQKHINKQVFLALNGGDSTTYGRCYDGQDFFDSDHTDAGAEYQTDQDNEYGLALSIDNFRTVRQAAAQFRDDRGEYVENTFDQLVVPPALDYVAAQIVGNPNVYDTGNREINENVGRYKPTIVTPHFSSAAWVLLATSEAVKPMLLAMKQQPRLLEAWYDVDAGDRGGQYKFKWDARYRVYYGNWRLAIMGQT